MEFRFLLNGTQIEEPIGFDDFKPQIERTDHHGISAGVSLSKIGFFGNSIGIIQAAYDTDIDTELPFVAQMKRQGDLEWAEIYSGFVDLSTYEKETGDVCRINCNVGEVGVKTTFNNRYDTAFSLVRETTLDGDSLNNYPMLEKEITIPSKGVLYESKLKVEGEGISTAFSQNHETYNYHYARKIPIGGDILNEIKELFPSCNLITVGEDRKINWQDFIFEDYETHFVYKDKNKGDVRLNVNLDMSISANLYPNSDVSLKFAILQLNENGSYKNTIKQTNYVDITSSVLDYNLNFYGDIVIDKGDKISVVLMSWGTNNNNNINVGIVYLLVKNTSYFQIKMISYSDSTSAKVALVHESFSKIAEVISGLTVKSNWYGRIDSDVNPIANTAGGGALKCLLNGYELRNADLPSGFRPPLQFSFKDLFDSMNAIDNIGWGFSLENGNLFIRVERWNWFYQDNVILEINGPKDVKRTLKSDKIYSNLKIGYSKYLDKETVNGIDTFHTDREYSAGIKAISNTLEKMCKFIADPYAIELTRRQQLNINEETAVNDCGYNNNSKSTKNWSYDEDIFVLELYYYFIDTGSEGYAVERGIIDSDGTIISPETIMNVRISPERNAIRWAEMFFNANSPKDRIDFTAGTGNVEAKGKVITPIPDPGQVNYYLQDSANGLVYAENQFIPQKIPVLKPEIISFDYPFTFEDYYNVLQNPYGKIIVDGEECYIQKITPSLMKGIASFELIPKA